MSVVEVAASVVVGGSSTFSYVKIFIIIIHKEKEGQKVLKNDTDKKCFRRKESAIRSVFYCGKIILPHTISMIAVKQNQQ